MEVFGFTVEELRLLMAKRRVFLNIFRGKDPEKEIAAWIERGGSAEIVRPNDFRTGPERERRPGVAGSLP
jgi:hypothetical protein